MISSRVPASTRQVFGAPGRSFSSRHFPPPLAGSAGSPSSSTSPSEAAHAAILDPRLPARSDPSRGFYRGHRSVRRALPSLSVEVLQELVRRELDLLVPPL